MGIKDTTIEKIGDKSEMFLCRECLKEDRPDFPFLPTSYGSCELCGKSESCMDYREYKRQYRDSEATNHDDDVE